MTRPLRLLFHHRIASRDGQAVHIEELIHALRQAGHDTLLVGPPAFAETRFGGSNALVDWIKRRLPGAVYELAEVAYNGVAFIRLCRAIRRYKPDVIYERFSLFLFAGIAARRLFHIPLLLEVNSPLLEERAKNDGLQLRGLGHFAQRLLWRSADHVLPVTGVLARTIQAYGVPPERIVVIPNGIDPARFEQTLTPDSAKAALSLPPRLVLGFTGFVRGWNAVHRLIDFAAAHPQFDLHVLVVGDGPARQSLMDHAAKRDIADRLTITGLVERQHVAAHISAFDIAVLPGVTPYSSPLKLFEYLQLGRAIIAPDEENIREVLTHGQNAMLFDTEAPGGLEDALVQLCADPVLRSRLASTGPDVIRDGALTWCHNARRIVSLAAQVS